MTLSEFPDSGATQFRMGFLAIFPATSLMTVAMFGGRLSYGFFCLTRFTVAATCLGLALWLGNSEALKKATGLIPFHISLAVLYQPVFRIHLTREIWWWVNLGTIIIFLLTICFAYIRCVQLARGLGIVFHLRSIVDDYAIEHDLPTSYESGFWTKTFPQAALLSIWFLVVVLFVLFMTLADSGVASWIWAYLNKK